MSGALPSITGAGGGIIPRGLINGASTFSLQDAGVTAFASGKLAVVSTPAVSIGVLTTVMSLSGRGAIGFLGIRNPSGVSQTERLKVTLDGVVIFDATSSASGSQSLVYTAIGQIIGSAAPYTVLPEYFNFNTSLLIEYASSRAGTGNSQVGYLYVAR